MVTDENTPVIKKSQFFHQVVPSTDVSHHTIPPSCYSWRIVVSSNAKVLKVKHLSKLLFIFQGMWLPGHTVPSTSGGRHSAHPVLTEQKAQWSNSAPKPWHWVPCGVSCLGFSSNTFQNCSSVFPSEPCWAVPTTIPAQLVQSPEQALQKLVPLQKPSCHQHHPSYTTTARFFNFHLTSRVLPTENCELWAFKCGNQ